MWYLVLSFAWVTIFPFVSRFCYCSFYPSKKHLNIWIFCFFSASFLKLKVKLFSFLDMICLRAYIFGYFADGRRCCCCFFLFLIHHPLETFFAHFLKINLQVPKRMTPLALFVWLLQPFPFWLSLVNTGT